VTLNCTVAQTYEGEQAQADIAEMAWRYDTPEDAALEIGRFATEDRVTFILQPVKTLVHGSPG